MFAFHLQMRHISFADENDKEKIKVKLSSQVHFSTKKAIYLNKLFSYHPQIAVLKWIKFCALHKTVQNYHPSII